MAMAAALAKVLRGGRARATQPLPPAMGRHHGPPEGLVGALLPRGQTAALVSSTGATSPASNASLAQSLQRKGSKFRLPLSRVEELSRLCVWINGSFQRYDSVYIPLHLWEIQRELNHQIWRCKDQWKYPVLAFCLLAYLYAIFLVHNYSFNQNKRNNLKLQRSIDNDEKEYELLKARYLKLKANSE